MLIDDYIKENEGLRLTAYKDTYGDLTIGYGHRTTYARTIDQYTADALFSQDLAAARGGVTLIAPWAAGNVRDVLTDMTFNMGSSGVARFDGFLGFLKAGDFERAAQDLLLTLYSTQVPNRARRNAASLMARELV